jgi:hypothetical protein
MDAAALAALCAVLSRAPQTQALPPGVVCPASAATVTILDGVDLAARIAEPEAREGIARVAFAEAGNQGDSGLAAVIYTILNRLADGRWGPTIDAVLNAPHQFEPVMRAGGDWRRLPGVSAAEQARVDTILNLAVEGRLPDLTHGARYFQNPAIVAARAQRGSIRSSLVNFGGQTPTVIIGAHSFFAGRERGGASETPAAQPRTPSAANLFVGENRVAVADVTGGSDAAPTTQSPAPAGPPRGDPSRALFVASDGQIRADPP